MKTDEEIGVHRGEQVAPPAPEGDCAANLHPVMVAPLAPHMAPAMRPEKLIDGLYAVADRLTDVERVLEGTYAHRGLWRHLPPERADALEKMLGGFDFLMTSKAVRAYADAWQAEIDAEGDQ